MGARGALFEIEVMSPAVPAERDVAMGDVSPRETVKRASALERGL